MSNPESLTLKVVQKRYPEQFGIESNHHEADGEWRDIYVSFCGYFGKFGPHMFAAAPALLEACKTFAEWLRREEAGFPAETRFNTPEGEAKWREWYYENLRVCALAQEQARAAIAKAEGTTP
jgi:hypothetical protein